MTRSSAFIIDTTIWLGQVRWNDQGLAPVIAQEHSSGDVLMLAWMNREALLETAKSGQAVYFSRSRNGLWRKGEQSGHIQQVHDIRLDCDQDAILIRVTQLGHQPGIACHTGRHSCFYQKLQGPAHTAQWVTDQPELKPPSSIYP